jgi:hypothetical protein
MKAVITKSQLDRIKNFINETREIPKSKVLKEYETKQGSEDFPFEIGFEFIRQNGGKDFLMSKGISSWAMFKKALLNKSIKSSDINQFKNVDGQSISDTEFGKQLPMNEKKSFPDLTGDGKVTRADILKGRGVELDEEKYSWDKCFQDALKRYGSKKIANKVCGSIKAKSKMDENEDCGCGGSEEHDTRYMFFSNLEQMMRQARILLQMDEDMIEDLLNNGHDWAADHIAEAKNNMDQVFDFIMNEMNSEDDEDEEEDDEDDMMYEQGTTFQNTNNRYVSSDNRSNPTFKGEPNTSAVKTDRYTNTTGGKFNKTDINTTINRRNDIANKQQQSFVNEGMQLKKKVHTSKELKNHLDNKISLSESEFRSGSPKHIELLKEVKELYTKGLISLNETDEFIVNEFDPKPVKIKGIGEVYLGLIQEEYESDEELLSESVYKGRKVQLGKPFLTPDGPKKRSVYVKNDKGNVVKVNFGQKGMKIKKNNPARRKSFRARMHCDTNPGPRWRANYWSCRAW